MWVSGYFCRRIGTVTKDIIEDYIENQIDEYDENFKVIGSKKFSMFIAYSISSVFLV